MQKNEETVKVMVRVRPMNDAENKKCKHLYAGYSPGRM